MEELVDSVPVDLKAIGAELENTRRVKTWDTH